MRGRAERAKQRAHGAYVGHVLVGDDAQVEEGVDVVDVVGGDLVHQAGRAGARHLVAGGVGGHGADVVDAQARQLGQVLGRVGGLLLGAQGLDVGAHGVAGVVVQAGQDARELGALGGRVVVCGGDDLDQRVVGRVAHDLAQEVLEPAVARLDVGAQRRERLLVAKAAGGVIVVVQPAVERVDGGGHAVGVVAVVALSQVELGLGQ